MSVYAQRERNLVTTGCGRLFAMVAGRKTDIYQTEIYQTDIYQTDIYRKPDYPDANNRPQAVVHGV